MSISISDSRQGSKDWSLSLLGQCCICTIRSVLSSTGPSDSFCSTRFFNICRPINFALMSLLPRLFLSNWSEIESPSRIYKLDAPVFLSDTENITLPPTYKIESILSYFWPLDALNWIILFWSVGEKMVSSAIRTIPSYAALKALRISSILAWLES